MDIIKIPSKNIYAIDNSKVINNATNGVNYNYDYPKKQLGDVSNRYYFTFHTYNYEEEKFEEKFTDKESTSNIDFSKYSYAGNIYLSAEIAFNINQITNIKIETTEEITRIISHKLKFNQIKMDSKEMKEYEEVANLQIDNFEYNEVTNIVTINFTILVAEYRGDLYRSYIYTMSGDIGIFGEYITFDRLKHTIGGTKNVTDLPTNELVQSLDPYLSNKILLEFAKGKETATLRCDISDYYEHDTKEKIISINNDNLPMCFMEHQWVVPYVRSADGTDRPMSLYKDGTAKVFEVIGSEISYDGAVFQKISIQEVYKYISS
jgi:hypothetical protein